METQLPGDLPKQPFSLWPHSRGVPSYSSRRCGVQLWARPDHPTPPRKPTCLHISKPPAFPSCTETPPEQLPPLNKLSSQLLKRTPCKSPAREGLWGRFAATPSQSYW